MKNVFVIGYKVASWVPQNMDLLNVFYSNLTAAKGKTGD